MGLAETYATYVASAGVCTAGALGAVGSAGTSLALTGAILSSSCLGALSAQLEFIDQLGCFRQVVLYGGDTPQTCRFSTQFVEAASQYFGIPTETVTTAQGTQVPQLAVQRLPDSNVQAILREMDANIEMLTLRYAQNAHIYEQWMQEETRRHELTKGLAIGLSATAILSVGAAVYFATRT